MFSDDSVVTLMKKLNIMTKVNTSSHCFKDIGQTKRLSIWSKGVLVGAKPCGFITMWNLLVKYVLRVAETVIVVEHIFLHIWNLEEKRER